MSDILDRLEDKLEGHRYDDYIAARCIFHDDSHASLIVHADTYSCLACGAYGKTAYLMRKLGAVATIYQSPIKDDTIRAKNPFFGWLRKSKLEDVLKEAWGTFNSFPNIGTYITNVRKIDPDTRRSLGIGTKDGFYTFPIWQGKTLAGAFVRSPNGADVRYFVPKGQNPNLLYIPFQRLLKTQGVLFVTFGGIDAISIGMCGFAAASTTNGKRIDPSAFDDIRKRIVLLPDKGEDQEARKIAASLGWRGSVRVLDYPDGCKDCNDLFRHNRDGLTECLNKIVQKET